MKIGDRIYVRGYIDEIRKDTVIVRNDGGYFGTVLSEVTGELPSAQPKIIRCKDCKHYLHDEEYGFDWCNRMSGVFRANPDGFCSWAVMRGGDSE